MSETSESERTEEATPRRRDEARTDGKIPRSAELTIAASLLGSAVVINTLAPIAGHGLFTIMGHSLSSLGSVSLDVSSATMLIRETAVRAFAATAGLIVAMVSATFIVAALQARGVVSMKPITPQFSRINPVENAKNLLGMRQIVELLKSLGKLAIVGGAVYASIKAALPDAITLSQTVADRFPVRRQALHRAHARLGGRRISRARRRRLHLAVVAAREVAPHDEGRSQAGDEAERRRSARSSSAGARSLARTRAAR